MNGYAERHRLAEKLRKKTPKYLKTLKPLADALEKYFGGAYSAEEFHIVLLARMLNRFANGEIRENELEDFVSTVSYSADALLGMGYGCRRVRRISDQLIEMFKDVGVLTTPSIK